MGYLKRRRSQLMLAAFFVFALTMLVFPGIDLAVSRWFFNGHAFPRDQWWQTLLHNSLNVFLCASLGITVAIWLYNRIAKRSLLGIDGRKVAYLFLVLIIGGGLIVNVAFKDNFGRARPRDVVEFNGTKVFTPAFVVSRECRENCSFSSGDAAGGFFSIALALAYGRRRRVLAAGLALGAVVSLGRLSSGAHFLSDIGTSFFVMLIVADVLYFYVVARAADQPERGLIRPATLAAMRRYR